MKQEKKYTKQTWKYHYSLVKICDEIDTIYRCCYTCKQVKPLDLNHFCKNSNDVMWFMTQCKECRNNYKRERKAILEAEAMKQEHEHDHVEQKDTSKLKQTSLFDENDSTETKLNKILAYLWLK